MIKLSEFKNALVQFVRPNRFLVEIFPPKAYVHKYNTKTLTYLAQSAKIPDRSCGEIEIKYHGMSVKLPGDYTHEDLSITFFNYFDWSPRNFFEDWMNLVQNIDKNNVRTDFGDLTDGRIIVKQLGMKENVLAAYTFFDIFPKSIQGIDLGMENGDTVETMTVDFMYSFWTQKPGADTSSAPATSFSLGGMGPMDDSTSPSVDDRPSVPPDSFGPSQQQEKNQFDAKEEDISSSAPPEPYVWPKREPTQQEQENAQARAEAKVREQQDRELAQATYKSPNPNAWAGDSPGVGSY